MGTDLSRDHCSTPPATIKQNPEHLIPRAEGWEAGKKKPGSRTAGPGIHNGLDTNYAREGGVAILCHENVSAS